MGLEAARPRERVSSMKRATGTETQKSDTPRTLTLRSRQLSPGVFGSHLPVGVELSLLDLVAWSPARELNMKKALGRPPKCKRYLC